MNKFNIVIFVAGAVVGSAATWFYAKKYYERIAQEEIDSVKAVFTRPKSDIYTKENEEPIKADNNTDNQHKADNARVKPDITAYANIINKEGYDNIDYHSKYQSEDENKEAPKEYFNPPYVIAPDEFGDDDDYTLIGLTYSADNILMDDADDPMDDLAGTVGVDFADHFGEYEADAVYIRNERLKCDYEILRDLRPFEEIVNDRF